MLEQTKKPTITVSFKLVPGMGVEPTLALLQTGF
jgi:hypothetical protein